MVPPLLSPAPCVALPGTSWLLLATHWLFLALFLALSLTLSGSLSGFSWLFSWPSLFMALSWHLLSSPGIA